MNRTYMSPGISLLSLGAAAIAAISCVWVLGASCYAAAMPTQVSPPRFYPRVEESEPVQPLPDGSAPEGLAWACCDPWSGICLYVEDLADCDVWSFYYACEWGVSNDDGTITCYETE
jgi:hypothetical protein